MAIDITPGDCVAEAPSLPAVGPEKRPGGHKQKELRYRWGPPG